MKTLSSFIIAVLLLLPGPSAIGAQDIFDAVRNGDLAKVKELVEKDPQLVKAKNARQSTPLHVAVDLNNEPIARYLIENGADVNTEGSPVFSPLYNAVSRGYLEVAELLVKGGADLDRPTLGMSLLHTAVMAKSIPAAEFLLSKGMDVNQRDKYGLTPLHMASELGLQDLCLFLIGHGADVNLRARDGATPGHLAEESAQAEIGRLLESHGAKALTRDFPVHRGKFLGAVNPGQKLELFAPNSILRIIGPHSGIAVSTDGKETFWVRGDYSGAIWWSKEVRGKWTAPRKAPFSGAYDNSYPCFSGDGKRLFFTSDRPRTEGGKREEGVGDIWYVERRRDGWGEPVNAGPVVNTDGDEFSASLSEDDTLYFTRVAVTNGTRSVDVYRSVCVKGEYLRAEPLGEAVNSSGMEVGPYISPDGRCIIFNSDRFGSMTTCVSFRNENGTWTPAKNIQYLFEPFSAPYTQGFTGDGRSILYAGKKGKEWDIYWISSKVIEDLRLEK